MGKLILSLSSNLEDMKKNIIKYIDLESERENVIIVPDRFSLLMELAIFQEKGVSSVFNANVMPVSSFATALLEKSGFFYQGLSTAEQALVTRRAMQKTKDDFVCLPKKVSPNLLSEVTKTISQLKSSNLSPQHLNIQTTSQVLNNKFLDLKSVYQEYEKLLGDKVDSGDLLNAFQQKADKIGYLKQVNLFFVGFDSFTNQIFELIKELKKHVEFIVVAGFYHFSKPNKNVFETDIYKKFSLFSSDKNFKIEYNKTTLTGGALAAFENVFAYKQNKCPNNDFVQLLSFKQKEHEIDYVTREIARKIKQEDGLKYSDFAIASSNLESDKNLIESSLIKYGINYFLDTQIKLSNTSLSEFILNFLNLFISGFQSHNLKNFMSSFFVGADHKQRSEINGLINKYMGYKGNIYNFESLLQEEDKQTFKEHEHLFKFLKEFDLKVKKAKKVQDFLDITNALLSHFFVKEKCEQRSVELELSDLKQQKIYLQLYAKVVEVLTSLQQYLSEEEITLNEFYELLKASFEDKVVATVPISSDGVFVGDVTQSFFGRVKHFYLIGASASLMPQTLFDGGILNDDDIESVSESLNISPTVKAINKRNKFKLLNLFSYIEKDLVVTYSFTTPDGKEDFASAFVEDLQNIFLQEDGSKIKIEGATTLGVRLPYARQKKLMLAYASKERALKQLLLKTVKNNLYDKRLVNSVFNVLNKRGDITNSEVKLLSGQKELPRIDGAKELFFKKGRVKVSQLEQYFTSPFLHFVSYGLGLQELETSQITRLEVGNFMHFVSERFIKKIMGGANVMTECAFDEILEGIFAEVASKKEFYKFYLNNENKNSFNYLKIEAKNMCRIILEHGEKSAFKPAFLEKSFFAPDYFKKQGLALSGRADRIDELNNNFLIYDYKTGKIEMTARTVYLGQKVQLLLYADIYQKQTGKKCSGVFYFPVKNSFEDRQSKKLKGFFERDNDTIFSLDNSISFENPNSQVIDAKLKTNKANQAANVLEFDKYTGTEYLQQMIEYAKKVCEIAIDQMSKGNIAQVEGRARFLEGLFEDDYLKKITLPAGLQITQTVFEGVIKDE